MPNGTFTTNPNSGSLFKNDRANGNPKAPQAKGKALIGGTWYWVSAWTKDGKNGRYQSLSFEAFTPEQIEKYADGGAGGQQPPARAPSGGGGSRQNAGGDFGDPGEELDPDSIPFRVLPNPLRFPL